MRVLYSPIGPSLDLEHVPTSYSFLITSSSSFDFFFLFFSLSLSLSLLVWALTWAVGSLGKCTRDVARPQGELGCRHQDPQGRCLQGGQGSVSAGGGHHGPVQPSQHGGAVRGGRKGQRGEDTIVGQVMLNTRKIKF